MVDEFGNFVKFNGYTIISKVDGRSHPGLSEIEKFISSSKVLSKYLKPTPSESYHMTITGLDHGTLLNVLAHMEYLLDRLSFGFGVKVVDVYRGETPGILFIVPPKIKALRNILRREASLPEDPHYGFHMTFGYMYKDVLHEDKPEFDREFYNLKKLILGMFPNKSSTLYLHEAALCEYTDMSNFVEISVY